MRTSIIVSVALAALVLAACGSQGDGELRDDPPAVKLYAVKDISIEYEYSGAAKGTKTHLIANYGMYQKMEDNLSYDLDGSKRDIHVIDITADTLQFHINMAEKTGTRRSFDLTKLQKLVTGYTEKELEDFQQAYIVRGGGKVIGTETILDKKCTVYELAISGVVVSLWKSITMRTKIKMGDKEIVMTAVDMDESFSPDAEMFLPPKNVKIEPPRVISNFPEGHPPVDAPATEELPEGHPSVDAPASGGMPPGHPTGDATPKGTMPPGHPPVQAPSSTK